MYEVNKGLAVRHFCNTLANKVRPQLRTTHTSLDLILLHSLPGHRVVPDDIRQSRRTEVLLARLLLRTMFPGILLHGLETVRPPAKLVMNLFVKFARLFANFQHPVGRQSKHLGDT